jgi:hypothetical protein
LSNLSPALPCTDTYICSGYKIEGNLLKKHHLENLEVDDITTLREQVIGKTSNEAGKWMNLVFNDGL